VSAVEIINQLPKLNETERRAILEKLRELAQQDDEQWERIIADRRPRPKLEAFVKQALSEGSEPLDLERLCSPAPLPVSGTRWKDSTELAGARQNPRFAGSRQIQTRTRSRSRNSRDMPISDRCE
jgi:hypothetical protein